MSSFLDLVGVNVFSYMQKLKESLFLQITFV